MVRGVVMEPMQGKLASSQIDFGYTEHFCIPGVTSVFLSSCDSVVGDSLRSEERRVGKECRCGWYNYSVFFSISKNHYKYVVLIVHGN